MSTIAHARRVTATTVLMAAAIGVGACASGSAAVQIQDAYIRVTAPSAPAAAYLVIVNNATSADALISASSPSFATVQLHETSVMGGASPAPSGGGMSMGSPAPSSTPGMDDMVGMAEVTEIPVPAGGRQELKPGSFHLMLMDPTGSITVGQTIDLTLTFRNAGKITVKATVGAA